MTKTSGAPRAGFRWAAACVLAATVAAGSAEAIAQPKGGGAAASAKKAALPSDVTGTVLDIDKEEIVLDVGSDAGVVDAMTVDLWRPLKLKHPVTGKMVSDRFKIGQIQITQVRPAMSLAKPVGTLSRAASTGDVILFPRAVAAPAPVTTAAPVTTTAPTTKPAVEPDEEPAPAIAPTDVDARNVTELFEGLKNQNIATRVARYEDFLRAHPESRFFTVIFEENIALKRLLQPVGPTPTAARQPSSAPFLVSSPSELDAIPGKPLRVSAEIGNADGAVLQVRRRGETLFVPMPMSKAGERYYSVVIPGDRIDDRSLELFIEASSGSAGTVGVFGSARDPKIVSVQSDPRNTPPLAGKGSITILEDFADYNRMRGNDWASQTEATFGIRFKDLGIRALRMGFGVYRGVGGSVHELDDLKLEGRPVGLTYGYVETEIGIHRLFSLMGRLSVGLLDDGVGGGGQLFARIGNDKGTNLAIGGEILGGVGLRSIIELQLNTFERFPILLRTEVSNQPAGSSPTVSQLGDHVASEQSEVAGRGVVQLGYRITPDFTIAVRGSFQGRNINHAGPGFGGSVGYSW